MIDNDCIIVHKCLHSSSAYHPVGSWVKEHRQRRLGIVGRSWWTYHPLTQREVQLEIWINSWWSNAGVSCWCYDDYDAVVFYHVLPRSEIHVTSLRSVVSVVKGVHFNHPTPAYTPFTIPACANTYQEYLTSSERELRSWSNRTQKECLNYILSCAGNRWCIAVAKFNSPGWICWLQSLWPWLDLENGCKNSRFVMISVFCYGLLSSFPCFDTRQAAGSFQPTLLDASAGGVASPRCPCGRWKKMCWMVRWNEMKGYDRNDKDIKKRCHLFFTCFKEISQ